MTEESRGRPARKYPPRIDATPEEIARTVLNSGRPKARVKSQDYRCCGCGREVHYPETLYRDGRCPECHRG
jgi:hypothetical protein